MHLSTGAGYLPKVVGDYDDGIIVVTAAALLGVRCLDGAAPTGICLVILLGFGNCLIKRQ